MAPARRAKSAAYSRQDWAEDRRWVNGDRAQSWQDRGGKRESQAQDGDRPQKQRR